MSEHESTTRQRLVRLPGCRRGCEERGWGVSHLALHTGLRWETAAKAYHGESVTLATQRAIAEAFDQNPASATMRELLTESAG